MKIRTANKDDAIRIATIHVKTWQWAYKGQMPDSFLNSLSIEKRTAMWEEQLQNPQEGVSTFVVEEDGHVVGWSTVGVSRDEDATKEIGELYGIYLDPEYIGKGIGAKFMEHVLNILREAGYKHATLWVLDTNENTRNFYEKKGWVIEGKTKADKIEDFELREIRYIRKLT